MKQTLKILTCCLLIQFSGIGYSQETGSKVNLDSLIALGNKLFEKGLFGKALPVWLKVLKADINNANANFKVGLCYWNSYDKQSKALPYFKLASENVSAKYNFYCKELKSAPYDAFFFLGEAYLALNKPDSAIKTYTKYRNLYNGKPVLNADKRIIQCYNAKALSNAPLQVKFTNINMVNSGYPETSPVITIYNSAMFYSSCRLREDQSNKDWIDQSTGKYTGDIYYTKKDGSGNWELPVIFEHSTDKDEAPVFISGDGKTLYFRRKDNGNYDLYSSNFQDGVWSAPVALSGVNSSYNETGASVTVNGKYMFFSSDREGGYGKYDIYYCIKKSNGKWGKPKNIGITVNSSDNETLPFVQATGDKLYFSSDIPQSMGGFDIFFSEMNADSLWSSPINLGYPVNTTGNDMSYYLTSGGTRYCSSLSDKLDYDLFRIEEGQFDASNLKPGTVSEITKELDVMEVVEIEKEIEKEVEVLEIIEKEVIMEKEVQVVEVMEVEVDNERDPEIVKMEMEKAKAEAEKAKAEAEAKKADAEKVKAEAEAKKAEAEKVKAEAEAKKADAEKAKADAIIAEAEKKKAEAEIKKADAQKAKADAQKAKIEKKTIVERAKVADAEKAQAEAKTAEENRLKAEAEAKIAEAETAKAHAAAEASAAEKAKADAVIAKANSDKAAAEKAKADAEKAKLDTEKAKADAVIAESEKVKAQAQTTANEKAKAEADAQKAKADQASATANAEKEKAAAAKAKSEADKAAADKAKAEADAQTTQAAATKASADAEKTKVDAERAKTDAERIKAEAEKVAVQKAITEAEAQKAKATADQAKAEADKVKAEQTIATSNAEKEKATAAKAKAEADKSVTDKAKAEADAQAAQANATKASADAEKAKADSEKAKADAEKAKAVAEKAKADAEKAKADAEKAKAEAEKAKAQQNNQ
ncbi:MAG: PD40 domain-containing protein [Bacteroidia bacterium]|nr:PD40 domain-containing protein [Bacteroidia bacterium]